jgi:hypothetical protein
MCFSSTWLSLFFFLELNTIVFVVILATHFNYSYSEGIVKYFFVQTFSSIIFVFCLLYNELLALQIIMVNILLLKIAIVPYQTWGHNLTVSFRVRDALIFLTIQKFGFIFLLVSFRFIQLIPILVLIVIIQLYFNNGWINTIFFSSLVHRLWIYVAIYMSIMLFLVIFLFYCSIIFIFRKISQPEEGPMSNIIKWKFELTLVLIVLRGLPPFFMFIIKWITISFSLTLSVRLRIIMVTVTFIILKLYWELIHTHILKNWLSSMFLIKISTLVFVNTFILIFLILI